MHKGINFTTLVYLRTQEYSTNGFLSECTIATDNLKPHVDPAESKLKIHIEKNLLPYKTEHVYEMNPSILRG